MLSVVVLAGAKDADNEYVTGGCIVAGVRADPEHDSVPLADELTHTAKIDSFR